MNNSQATTKQMDADGEQQAFMAKNLPEFGKGLVSPNLHLTGSEAQAARTITDNDSSVFVSASSGKSILLQLALIRNLNKSRGSKLKFKTFFISPFSSNIATTIIEWRKIFKSINLRFVNLHHPNMANLILDSKLTNDIIFITTKMFKFICHNSVFKQKLAKNNIPELVLLSGFNDTDGNFKNVVEQVLSLSENNIPRFVSVSQVEISPSVIDPRINRPIMYTYNIAPESLQESQNSDFSIFALAFNCSITQETAAEALAGFHEFQAKDWLQVKQKAIILGNRHHKLVPPECTLFQALMTIRKKKESDEPSENELKFIYFFTKHIQGYTIFGTSYGKLAYYYADELLGFSSKSKQSFLSKEENSQHNASSSQAEPMVISDIDNMPSIGSNGVCQDKSSYMETENETESDVESEDGVDGNWTLQYILWATSEFALVKWKSKVNASPSSGMNIEWIPFGKPYIDHECPLAVCFWDAYWSMTEWLDFQEDKYNSMSPLLQFATYLEQLDTELMPAEGDDNRFGKNDIGPLIDALKYADGKEEFRI